ncbi:acetyl-CoA synthetase-like protein [Aspergillus fijiensis CBS 313.89]|uniref:Acetyl-CoA synthetase-like protein n=1 Tax=Aspergillus fijiensis CBS 313.89 TaxID=1448319 RepID=A0A8G1RKG9_9EURO|nr:acetyl-CoA synthetase-like protein [Aspergillus fijiensis CBS 313.89]RAK74444.1 acetyl-CoA synthetase-like protein [Aspergillus fijiensis CBS 313.89]
MGDYQPHLPSWTTNLTPPVSHDYCAHDLIGAQCRAHPDAPAISSWDGEMTYRELNALSTRLADYLIAHGVQAEVLVPILFAKSQWMIVALLGVLKAGGGVILLAASTPEHRLQQVLDQAQSPIVLASASCGAVSGHILRGTHVVVVDDDFLAQCSSSSGSTARCGPHNVAYVAFTSGSTGAPKGAVVEHRSLCTSALEFIKTVQLDPRVRMFQFSAYSFDIAVLEIVFTLLCGGCICVPSEDERMNAPVASMVRMRVTHAFFTQSLLPSLDLHQVPTLRVVLTGGETPKEHTVRQLVQSFQVYGVYGPCECAVVAAVVRGAHSETDLGAPSGCRLWIVDRDDPNRLCGSGETGELVIEGSIVGRGYLADRARSREFFIAPPAWMRALNVDPVGRLYRTGDMARYDEQGKLWFRGRQDSQVKVNGQRLELGEVEARLQTELQCLREDVFCVLAMLIAGHTGGGGPGEKRGPVLMAQRRFDAMVVAMRSRLRASLPAYAIPSLYIPIRSVPVTVNGKTDRERLLAILAQLPASEARRFTGPSSTDARALTLTGPEKQLRDAWAAVLRTMEIGPKDNFFSLGGSSILAMELVSQAGKRGLHLTVNQVLLHPLLADMAAAAVPDSFAEPQTSVAHDLPAFSLLLDSEREVLLHKASNDCQVPVAEVEDIYPATAQQIFSIHAGITSRSFQMQAVYALPAMLDEQRFARAWDRLAQTHEILRTHMIRHPSGSGYVQVVVKTGAGLAWRRGTSLQHYLEEEHEHIVGTGDPLFRLGIVKDEQTQGKYLVMTVNHAGYDAWSLSQLFLALRQAYVSDGCPPPSPPGLKYKTFIRQIVAMDRDAATRFWTHHLKGVDTRPFPPVAMDKSQPVNCDTLLTRLVRLDGQSPGPMALSTLVNAAWAVTFAEILHCPDIILGVFGHGRCADLPGVGDLIAPTMTAYPLRIRVLPGQTVGTLCRQIQADTAAITAYEQFHFRNIARISPEIMGLCMSAVRLNLLPKLEAAAPSSTAGTTAQSALPLPLLWGQLAVNLPFRLSCTLGPPGVQIEAIFDLAIVAVSTVEEVLRKFECALLQLHLAPMAVAGESPRVDEICLDGWASLSASALTESITAASEEAKRQMLVSYWLRISYFDLIFSVHRATH